MTVYKLLLLFILSIFLVPDTATAAAEQLISPAPHATKITSLNNINLGDTYKVFRSKSGYVWIGTLQGLIRYDGYHAKQYRYDSDDSHSISHNTVFDIIEDDQQNLWISTYGGGLNKFTPQTGRFEKMDLSLPGSDTEALHLYFLSIDAQNQLWIGSRQGLLRFDILAQKAVALPKAMAQLPIAAINGAVIDHQKNLWMGTFAHGVYYFEFGDDGQGKLHHFTHDKSSNTSISNNNVRTTFVDESGDVWLGTTMGLNKYNRAINGFERFKPSAQNDLKATELQDDIVAIQSDSEGNLWFGTMGGGSLMFERNSQRFSLITGANDVHKKFGAARINAIGKDVEDNLWFSTVGGVVLVTKKARQLKYLTNADASLKVTDVNLLKSSKIAVIGDEQLYQYDPQCHCAESFLPQLHRPFKVTEDGDSNLWIATHARGLSRYSQNNQTIQHFDYNKTDSPVPNNNLSEVFIDSNKNIWLTAFIDLPRSKGGIYSFDPHKPGYQTYLETPWFTGVTQLGEDELLLSSDVVGLTTLNTRTGQSTQWHETIASAPLRIFSMFVDSEDSLWLGTSGQGLAYFDRNKNQFVFYNAESGLLTDNITSIVEDNDHNLWLGSKVGLTRFNPQTGDIMNLEQQDGLLFSSFFWRSSIKTEDGKLILGTFEGLVKLDPNDFNTAASFPHVVINDFKLLNKAVQLSTTSVPTPLQKVIEYTDKLVLTHRDDVFSFGFAALEYQRPDKIQFAYQMEGLNDDWQYTDGSNRIASYTTLPAGQYVFKVKASNAEGQWGSEVSSIKVTILPPWWLSWPAYVFYALFALGGIYLYIRVRTQKLMAQAKLLELSVVERTQQLQHSNQQLAEQSNAVSELLSQKQRLFASISHEFRTPLTLILSPVDQLLTDEKGQAINKELNLIKRSGRRLLRMVDQLLEFAKLEQHSNETGEKEQVSLTQTIAVIMASFEALARDKHITLRVLPFDEVTLSVLPDSLNKILINIVSNACKYTPENGHITLSVQTRDKTVEIAVEDNGVGIDEKFHQTIFERFNRASFNQDESVSGAGIGLALVKELVEANEGTISLVSALDQGSTFCVVLPIAQSGQGTAEQAVIQPVLEERLALEIDSVATTKNTPIDSQPGDTDSQKKSILIIDDNADMRQLLTDQLSGQYQCLQAPNGKEGLRAAQQQMPDLIISDVMMPVMDGYELAQALKANELTSHIPLILLTAKGSMESRIKGLQLLVDDYLAKPFNVEELTLRINNILTIRDIVRKRCGQAVDNNAGQAALKQLGLNEVEQAFLDKLNAKLDEHYEDVELSIKSLSGLLFISEKQLQRKVRALLDVTIPELVRNYRLKKSIELLDKGHTASQVYFTIGFSSHSYFCKCFKAKFGLTPSEYLHKE